MSDLSDEEEVRIKERTRILLLGLVDCVVIDKNRYSGKRAGCKVSER